ARMLPTRTAGRPLDGPLSVREFQLLFGTGSGRPAQCPCGVVPEIRNATGLLAHAPSTTDACTSSSTVIDSAPIRAVMSLAQEIGVTTSSRCPTTSTEECVSATFSSLPGNG